MLALGVSSSLNGSATSATTVNVTVTGALLNNGAPPVAQSYNVLYQGQLASSVGALLTTSSSQEALICSIHLFNTGATVQTVNLYVGGTASTNQINSIQIPPNGWASYEDGQGWTVYNASGLILSGAAMPYGAGTPGGGTPTSIGVGADTLVAGTLVSIPASAILVGSRWRFTLNIAKTTSAGTATWTTKVKWGTTGTYADAAVLTWTSGTNTAAIDQAIMIIEVVIATTGASGNFTGTMFYVNSLTNVTGLGLVTGLGTVANGTVSGSGNYLHVDLNAGTSAVMTAVGAAERLV